MAAPGSISTAFLTTSGDAKVDLSGDKPSIPASPLATRLGTGADQYRFLTGAARNGCGVARGTFIDFGGPQAHGHSLTVTALKEPDNQARGILRIAATVK